MRVSKIISTFFVLSINSCFVPTSVDRTPLVTYKVDSSRSLVVYNSGNGATARDITEIVRLERGRSFVLKRIDNSFTQYKPEIIRISDTLFRITFIDTSIYKGKSISYDFNINHIED
jgi:hypothetical protein